MTSDIPRLTAHDHTWTELLYDALSLISDFDMVSGARVSAVHYFPRYYSRCTSQHTGQELVDGIKVCVTGISTEIILLGAGGRLQPMVAENFCTWGKKAYY